MDYFVYSFLACMIVAFLKFTLISRDRKRSFFVAILWGILFGMHTTFFYLNFKVALVFIIIFYVAVITAGIVPGYIVGIPVAVILNCCAVVGHNNRVKAT